MFSNKIVACLIFGGLFTLLIASFYIIISPFLEGIAWALILSLITWPALNSIKKYLSISDHYASLILTLALTSLLLTILVPGFIELGKELLILSSNYSAISDRFIKVLSSFPVLSDLLESQRFSEILKSLLEPFIQTSIGFARQASQIIAVSLFNIGVMLFSIYFIYRHGSDLKNSLASIVVFFGGPKWLYFFELIQNTIKGVVYGALLTAPSQGILAGIGFYFAGVPMPAIWGLATVFISFVPFGAPMIYVPASLYLFIFSENVFASIGLLIWGVAVVSTIDNIIRPIFISHAIQISLLLVFVGVVGGIFAFGLIGLFIGPVIVAIIQALWKELVSISMQKSQPSID